LFFYLKNEQTRNLSTLLNRSEPEVMSFFLLFTVVRGPGNERGIFGVLIYFLVTLPLRHSGSRYSDCFCSRGVRQLQIPAAPSFAFGRNLLALFLVQVVRPMEQTKKYAAKTHN
jgi:hypothetical protein